MDGLQKLGPENKKRDYVAIRSTRQVVCEVGLKNPKPAATRAIDGSF